jgi:hypothetical protein
LNNTIWDRFVFEYAFISKTNSVYTFYMSNTFV